jgi:hypothetical protein
MGAALTYARRYALFTLVGIAGEDDLDAPDLESPIKADEPPPRVVNGGKPTNGRARNGHDPHHDIGSSSPLRSGPPARLLPSNVLPADQSATLRTRLIAELDSLRSSDEAASWAQRCLPLKNTLTAGDAELLEAAFAAKLAALAPESPDEATNESAKNGGAQLSDADQVTVAGQPNLKRARLATKTIRLRDKEHRKFVSQQPCLVCGRSPCDAHHLRFAQPRALGRKVSDEFTIPLCRTHHRQLHRRGDEEAWWAETKIDPLGTAKRLWDETRRL